MVCIFFLLFNYFCWTQSEPFANKRAIESGRNNLWISTIISWRRTEVGTLLRNRQLCPLETITYFRLVRLQTSVFTQCRLYFKILYMFHASNVMTYDQCDPSLTHCERDCFTGINLLLVGWTQQTPSWNCCENNRRNVHWKWDVVITIDVFAGMFISKVTRSTNFT